MRPVQPGTLAIAALLAACTPAPQPGPAAHTPAATESSAVATNGIPTAIGTGVVESIDAAAATITLSHEPIAELGWPAMTMDFLAAPTLANHAKPGDRVRFGFHAQGARFVITRIEALR